MKRRARRAVAPRIGLALAGGGPLGAIYEIGALCALDESLEGLDFTQLHGYVGVSAGSFIAAGLANGMRPRELCAAFIGGDDPEASTDREHVQASLRLRPAWAEFAQRLAALPSLTAHAALHYAFGRRSLLEAFERLGRALPTGLLNGDAMEREMALMFEAPGRSNDFRKLKRRLVLVATDLDSGEALPFGQPGLDDVPISLAVQASAALPGLYAPVMVKGRTCVDGALKKTLHATVLLDEGLDLLICLNPLVPFDATQPPRHKVLGSGEARIPRLVDGGLPVVLSQTFRSLIHSRLELGMRRYADAYPDTEIVLFEPEHRDAQMFLANSFSLSTRRLLAEHAYQRTRELLRSRRSHLRERLARHGVTVCDAVLDDASRHLLGIRRPPGNRAGRALKRLDELLDDLERSADAWAAAPSPAAQVRRFL
ncbi:MAG: patatin-like phospholipase family protein [Burkholderiaceae bacterium]